MHLNDFNMRFLFLVKIKLSEEFLYKKAITEKPVIE